MDNPFLLHPRDLRKRWRDLRRQLLPNKSDAWHLDAVLSFWNMAPTTRQSLNYHDPHTWPDPWTMIDSKEFDQNSIGLGCFYTLVLSDDARWTDRVQLGLYRDHDRSMEGLCCIADKRWLLGMGCLEKADILEYNSLRFMSLYCWNPATRSLIDSDTIRQYESAH
jgi:hypothetical protein